MTGASPESGGVFRLVTVRPVAVTMVFVTLFTFGWESLQRLPLNLLPDISYPRVTVRAEYPGAAPEDVEERVSKRLHEALSVLADLESISSISRAGVSDLTLEFAWGTQLTYAIQDIRERLDRTILPLEVETPIILRYDPTLAPILTLGLTGGQNLFELRTLAEDDLAPTLSTVEGVAAVRVRGGLEDEIQVRLKGDKLVNYGLRAEDVVSRLAAENVNLASGTVLEGDTEYLVRILNEYRDVEEIGRTILVRDGDSSVRLSDVATVHRTNKERDVITRIDGRESVELQVFKEADANIVDLARRVIDRAFGTAEQRAYLAQLRTGAIVDPEARLLALQTEIRSGPALAAELAKLEQATSMRWQAERGGPPSARAAPEAAPQDEQVEDPAAVRAREVFAELEDVRDELRLKNEAYDYLVAELPSDVRVHTLSDQSKFIESALAEVRSSAVLGAFFSVLVLYLFLRKLSTTLIIAVAIPVSVIVTFVPLHLSGTTLNVMSLGGLALGIGMVVDNAIVVLESIARCREQGMGRREAAVSGVREVAGAATASTLTTVAVFAPIVFVEGIAGQVFGDQALTVVASLVVSLIVALFLVPMLASRGGAGLSGLNDVRRALGSLKHEILKPLGTAADWRRTSTVPKIAKLLFQWWTFRLLLEVVGRVLLLAIGVLLFGVTALLWLLASAFGFLMYLPAVGFSAAYGLLHRHYGPFIASIVRSPTNARLTLVVAVLLMAWTVRTASTLGSELLPEVYQGEVVGRIAMQVGTPLEETNLVARLAEEALDNHPDVAWVSSTVGVPRDEINQPDEGEHTARITIGLRPQEDMQSAEERLMAFLRSQLSDLPELRDVRFERPSLFTVRSPIAVEIKGNDLAEIAAAAERVEGALNGIPGLRDVRSTVQPGNPEVMLSFDRDLLSRYGLDTSTLASTVRGYVEGQVATRFTDEEHKLDVLVQMDKSELQSLEDLMRVPVNPTSPSSEPLSALSRVQVREGPREIRRIWGQRAAVVSASLAGFDIGRATEQIERELVDIERTGELVIGMSGQAQEADGALSQMTTALLLAVFLVYVVMASIFESLLQPLIIMVTVPLAFFGAVAALWMLDIPLSVVVFIGGIILAGIVVNNAIVLIDACNRRRRLDGMSVQQAVATACEMRLRPILMTTMTTVLGLLPLTGWLPSTGGEGTELRAPMAVTVVAGLSAATLLTLIVIPTVYVLVEGALEGRRGRAPDDPGMRAPKRTGDAAEQPAPAAGS